LSITNGKTKLKYIFGLFINYFKSLNLEERLHMYVFAQRIGVSFDTLHRCL